MIKDFQVIQSKTINWLRFPLIVLVVYIHNYGSAYDYSPIINWTNISSIDIYEIIRILFSKVISHIAVPCFFLISGYLFFYNVCDFNKQIYVSKLKKRVKTLLVPYLLWNIIAIIIDFCNYYGNHNLTDSINHTINNLWYFFTNPLDYPLWYVRNLMILSVVSPLFFYLLKKIPYALVLLLVLGLFIGGYKTNVNSAVFFGFGAFLSINKVNIITTFRRIKIPIYIIAFITMCLCVYFNSKYTETGKRIYPLFLLTGIISIFNLASICVEKELFKEKKILTSSVFFIYAIHVLLPISWTNVYFQHAFSLSEGNYGLCTVLYLIQPILKTALCIVIFLLLKMIAPKVVYLLSGSRSS